MVEILSPGNINISILEKEILDPKEPAKCELLTPCRPFFLICSHFLNVFPFSGMLVTL